MKILKNNTYEDLISNQKKLLGYKLKLGIENRFGNLLDVKEFNSFDDLFEEVFKIKNTYMRFEHDDLSQGCFIVQAWNEDKIILQFKLYDGEEI